MEDPSLPEAELDRAYGGLARTHRVLGTARAIVRAIRRDRQPVRRVLDIGCGRGDLLAEIRVRLGVEAVGIDLRPPAGARVPVIQADAVRDALPACDVAITACTAHHLSEDELIALIRNVGRSARRFILLDLVRHPLPLVLFRAFLGSMLPAISVWDGCLSIRRSWTPAELRVLVGMALEGTTASFRHRVAMLYTRQIVEIDFHALSRQY